MTVLADSRVPRDTRSRRVLLGSAARKYECARCGKKQPTERMVFSSWTRKHYCGFDLEACDRRTKRRWK